MPMIFDGDGNEIADIPLSDKQQAVLDCNEEIIVIYHTPQLLRFMLGEQAGSFAQVKRNDRLTAIDAGGLRAYAALQKRIRTAWQERLNGKT